MSYCGQGQQLASGEGRELSLHIAESGRHHAGHYTCHADNGWGQLANATVSTVRPRCEILETTTFKWINFGRKLVGVLNVCVTRPVHDDKCLKLSVNFVVLQSWSMPWVDLVHCRIIFSVSETNLCRYSCMASLSKVVAMTSRKEFSFLLPKQRVSRIFTVGSVLNS